LSAGAGKARRDEDGILLKNTLYMMNMKIAFCLLTVASLALAGCGGDQPATPATPDAPKTPAVKKVPATPSAVSNAVATNLPAK